MDYYSILDISSLASDIDIKKAYHKQALIWHPDKNDNSKESIDHFQKISEAYQILSDNDKRKEYDTYGTFSSNLKSPAELFAELFSNIDPVIYTFLTNTFSHITDTSDITCDNFWDIFKNIDKDRLIEDGGNIVKHILKKTISKNTLSKKNEDSSIEDKYIFKLRLNVNDIDDINTINLTIDCVRSFTHIKLHLFNADSEMCYLLDTNYDEHIVNFRNKEYSFLLEDSFPEGYFRHNVMDIILKYDINYKYISTGYRLEYIYETDNPLHVHICFTNNSNIVKIPGKGCLNTKTKLYGDLYIIFNYTYDTLYQTLETHTCRSDMPIYTTHDPISLLPNDYT